MNTHAGSVSDGQIAVVGRPSTPLFRCSCFAAAMAVMICAGRAGAQTAPPERRWRLEVGATLGYAVPFGRYEGSGPSVLSDRSLSRDIVGQVPLTLAVGARLRDGFYVGIDAAIAQAFLTHDGTPGDPARALPPWEPYTGPHAAAITAFHAIGQARYRFHTAGSFRPELGAGTGIEWMKVDQLTYRGWPFFAADVGAGIPVGGRGSLGLYISGVTGRFMHAYDAGPSSAYSGSTYGVLSPPLPPGRDVANPTWHGWIGFGVRGTFTVY